MKRLVTGALAGAAWLTLVLAGPFPLFWLVVVALSGLALDEYFRITLAADTEAIRRPLIFFGLFPVLAAGSGGCAPLLAGLFSALAILFLFVILRYAALADPFALLSRAGFAYLYLGLGAAHLILLMALPEGRAWLLLLSAITAGADTAAFYAGTKFGRHKLCPAISPAKSWEGLFGGLVGAVAAALLVHRFFLPEEGMVWFLAAALIVALIGVAGDLGESVCKRTFGVKDSGALLPGHGGLLDRIDSLLLAGPALYYLLFFRSLQLP